LPDSLEHYTVSRHHCVLSIDPPRVRVRDLGSRNGTYVNGQLIGHRSPYQSPAEAFLVELPARDLCDGDELRVGDTIFRVNIIPPPACAAGSKSIAGPDRTEAIPA
jgi:pSer/pThr/pTyr-binding forkhead associated (FHA) protein